MVGIAKELSDLSQKLNEEADNLNAIISSVNEGLRRLDFGIEVWHGSPVIAGDERDWNPETNARIDPERDALLLGYCYFSQGDAWELAVKHAIFVDKTLSDSHPFMIARKQKGLHTERFTVREIKNPGRPMPLLAASRAVRLKAMDRIPALLSDVKIETEKLIYWEKIQPHLDGLTVTTISETLGVPEATAKAIREGRRCPRPRHWQALAKLVGVSIRR